MNATYFDCPEERKNRKMETQTPTKIDNHSP